MTVYLPLIEMSLPLGLLLLLGAGVGILSGLFGVGGGFLLTPVLILLGVPPVMAVGTVSAHIVASTVPGVIAHWKKRTIDMDMIKPLFLGGLVGTLFGLHVFQWLRTNRLLDVVVVGGYVFFLGLVGIMMLVESLRALWKASHEPSRPQRGFFRQWIARWPLQRAFPLSRTTASLLFILSLGAFVSFVGAILGLGGGFLLMPLLIYALSASPVVAVGTTTTLVLMSMTAATFFHAASHKSVDVVLAFILMVGGILGASLGARLQRSLGMGQGFRLVLACLLLLVAFRFGSQAFITPTDLFELRLLEILR